MSKADSKSKEAETLEHASKKYALDFVYPVKGLQYSVEPTQQNRAMVELLQETFTAGADWHTQQSAADKERIKELEAALLEIKRDIYENDVCDVIAIIETALNK